MASELKVDTISEKTTGSGVTIDGVLVKDGGIASSYITGGTGKVLQVVSTTYSTQVVNSGTSYVDSGLSLAITPSSTSSKVLVMIQQSLLANSNGYSFEGVDYKLIRDTTDLIEDNFYGKNFIQYSGTMLLKTDANYFYVDTPSTTSSTTYKTQFMPHRTDVTTTAKAQDGSSTSTMVLMEIAG